MAHDFDFAVLRQRQTFHKERSIFPLHWATSSLSLCVYPSLVWCLSLSLSLALARSIALANGRAMAICAVFGENMANSCSESSKLSPLSLSLSKARFKTLDRAVRKYPPPALYTVTRHLYHRRSVYMRPRNWSGWPFLFARCQFIGRRPFN